MSGRRKPRREVPLNPPAIDSHLPLLLSHHERLHELKAEALRLGQFDLLPDIEKSLAHVDGLLLAGSAYALFPFKS